MKRTKRIFFLTFLCILGTLAAASALHAGNIAPAPVNPEFIQYLKDLRSGTAGHRFPPKAYILPESRPRAARAVSAVDTIPVSFDLEVKGWLTHVKDQRRWGTCWDFATVEAMESNLKKETGVEHELSELHLGFFAYYPESEEKAAFDQDPNREQSPNPIFDNGGYPFTSRAILSRGTGPVYEKDAPYPTADVQDAEFWRTYPPEGPEALKRELLAVRPAFRLKESLTFNDTEEIKQALMQYGGLWIGFDASSAAAAADPNNEYIYTSDPEAKPNHAVLLVGWDDTIAASNFKDDDDDEPDGPGAWRIQNSWSDKVGNKGYYWISYEDTSIFNEWGASSFVAMPADSYRYNYSHDPLGSVVAIEAAGSTAATANVFTAERDEEIVSVGFYTMVDDNMFSIQIYKDVPAGGMPDEGTPALSAPMTGMAEFSGYRTVKLDTPVPLAKGERFAVAVVLMDDDDSVYIPVEAKIDGLTSQASAKPGESFVDGGEGWEEVMDQEPFVDPESGITIEYMNLSIKAFTESSGGSGGGCSTGASIGAFALLLAALVPLARRGR